MSMHPKLLVGRRAWTLKHDDDEGKAYSKAQILHFLAHQGYIVSRKIALDFPFSNHGRGGGPCFKFKYSMVWTNSQHVESSLHLINCPQAKFLP